MSLVVLLLGALIVPWSEVNAIYNCLAAFSSENAYNYHYELPKIMGGYGNTELQLSFRVKATNDAFIALVPNAVTNNVYEIDIGGWGNTYSVIRRCKECEEVAGVSHSPLSGNEYRGFVLTVKNGRVALYLDENYVQGEMQNPPILEYQDPTPMSFNYIGFSTGWGATGEWIFDTCSINMCNVDFCSMSY